MTYRLTTMVVAILLATLPTFALAIDVSSSSDIGIEQEGTAAEDITTLKQVTVVGQAEDPLTGKNTLDRRQLDFLPGRNGSLNEALGVLPGVQFGEEHRTSDNAGEISPPNLSISGGRFYENNFMIDGVGNNSRLDPAFTNINFTEDVPGHPQEIFLHPSLVEKTTVYRGNVPARYGGFTGGVVDVETRDPASEFGGEINLRHTRSEWTSIHSDDERKEEYHQSDGSVQPEFRKYDGSFLLDVPLNEDMGLLVGYSQVYSKIPLYNIDKEENQYRQLENYFLKYVADLGNGTNLSISGTYSPYEADHFLKDTLNSGYTLENEAYSITTNLEHIFKKGTVKLDIGYRNSSNKREANDDHFNWAVSPSKPWGAITDEGETNQYSREGGRGDLDKEQQTWEANLHISLDPIRTGNVWHSINFGLSHEWADSTFDRGKDHTKHTFAWPMSSLPDVVKDRYLGLFCEPGSVDCIDGEQLMIRKDVYPEDHTDASIQFFDAYFDDEIIFGRLSFRPGLRFSRDDFYENSHSSPRFAASFDLFGDGQSVLFTGANRYYSRALLSHALKDDRLPYKIWTRSPTLVDNMPQPWIEKERTTFSGVQLADLKTPYSDEKLVGLDQQILGGLFNVMYLEREGRDEIASTVLDRDPDGYTYTEWTNDGRSSHKEVTLSYVWQSDNHYILISGTWQDSETTHSTYIDRADSPDDNDDGQADPVWYRGDIVQREELPKADYNRKYKASMTYIGQLPYGFTFTNITHYRDGYEKLAWDLDQGDNGKVVTPQGELHIYDRIEQPSSWMFDWRLEWENTAFRDKVFITTLEINNVFNDKVEAGANDDVYDLGRQFWLGMTYKF